MVHYYFTPTLFDGLGNVAHNVYIGVQHTIIVSISTMAPTANSTVTVMDAAVMPAMINAHCHLELSYLHNKIEKHTGINNFIATLEQLKTNSSSIIEQHALLAQQAMLTNGIIAVGDISNTAQTFAIKQQSAMYYHTFVELYGFSPERALTAYANGITLLAQLKGCAASITPHAPYSVSNELMQLITNECTATNSPVTIHTQESKTENEFFEYAMGKTYDRIKSFGINLTTHHATQQSAMAHVAPLLPKQLPLQYVHNTFTTAQDIELAIALNPTTYWCLCPNANSYIENSLPNIPMLMQHNATITLGTDSLASNDKLCVLSEMQTIQQQYPTIPTQTLVQWATYNGAKFLGIDADFGSVAVGRKANFVLLTNFNHAKGSLLNSKVSLLS